MKIKDLTKEQAIEIAKLIYGYEESYLKNCIKSDFEFEYQPYDHTWYEDAREYARVTFMGIVFGNTTEKIMLEINTNLDCYLYYCRADGAHSLGSRNQYKIQNKFKEWNIEPNDAN